MVACFLKARDPAFSESMEGEAGMLSEIGSMLM